MSSKTKIVVLKSKELIYTGIFVVLGILLIILLVYMFSPSKKDKDNENLNENANEQMQTETSDENLVGNAEIVYSDEVADVSYIDQNAGTSQVDYSENIAGETIVEAPSTEDVSTESAVEEISTEETVITSNTGGTYKSGVYSSILNVGGQTELQLLTTVDNGRVSHIDIVNLSDAVTVMYPLITPSLNEINAQLDAGCAIEDITYSGDNKYTTTLILQAVMDAIN
ncbi:MAG: hypothetical protein IJV15_03060 [Lachnospiraceae bacterium]|nr:hypothetical protein [Lachnospiraceae bacterium]